MSTVIDGSASVTINSGAVLGITSGTAVASTSGTSIDFTGIPSWVKRITIMLNQISTSGTSSGQIQIGSGSVTTSGYLSSAVGGVAGNTVSGSVFSTGFVLNGTGAFGASSIYQSRLTLCLLSGNTWTAQGSLSVTSGTATVYVIDGTVSLGGTLDRVRITTVNGTDTFDAGTINILYEG